MWSFTASAWSCGGWVRGIPMAINLPVAAFPRAWRFASFRQDEAETVCLTLEHPDPDLSITLYRSGDSDEVVAEWQSWAKILLRPLLVTDDSGALHELFARLGQLRLGASRTAAPSPHGDERASAVDRLAPAQWGCGGYGAPRGRRT